MNSLGRILLAQAIPASGSHEMRISSTHDIDFIHCNSAVDAKTLGALVVHGQKTAIKVVSPDVTQHRLSDGSFIIIHASSSPGTKNGWMVYASNASAG
jgi:hypothetical protein